ncbi:hypothetical protein E8E11_000152 [Didymella keratinophila]|nr:hypothetical protein E8E11_000152 [Didymella keratinophila]
MNFFARRPQPGEYLLFSWDGRSRRLPLLHGIRTIIDLAGIERISAGPAGRARQRLEPAKEPAKVMLKCTDLDWINHFEQLHTLAAPSPCFAVDVAALNKLQLCFEATYGRNGGFKGDVNLQDAFIWPYQLGKEFTAPMQSQQLLSLIIAAHFALLFMNLEFTWYVVGWCDHILTGVANVIPEEYRNWLEWPFEQARRICGEKVEEGEAIIIDTDATSEPTVLV